MRRVKYVLNCVGKSRALPYKDNEGENGDEKNVRFVCICLCPNFGFGFGPGVRESIKLF